MIKNRDIFSSEARKKVNSLSMGLALGAGAMILGSGCAASGACPTCGACVTGIPLLAAPLIIDSAVILVGNIKKKKEQE